MKRRQHQVARLRRLHRDARSFLIADLADEHDVGILAQDRPQRARECQLDLGVDLRLVDARESGTRPGSSIVTMFVRSDRTDVSAEHNVVVLPEPVGPTTRIIPCWWRRKNRSCSSAAAEKPELLERRHALAMIEHAQHDLLAEDRPQRRDAEVDFLCRPRRSRACGRPAAAASRRCPCRAMIFMRATSPSWTHFGRSMTSFSSPSSRWRTTTSFSVGSMWMSLARLLSALLMTRLTMSMIGADLTSRVLVWLTHPVAERGPAQRRDNLDESPP